MSLFKYKFIKEPLKPQGGFFIFKRFKSKKPSEKYLPTNRALSHFDDFYKALFGERWPSVRLALLSKPKYVAVINNYGEVEKTEEFFQSQGAFDLKQFLDVQRNYVGERDVGNSKQTDGRLEEVISKQLLDEEEKALKELHPEGLDFKLKVDSVKQKSEEEENEDDYEYKPEDARTSLSYDLNKAHIDETRFIPPDSKVLGAKLNEFIPATLLRGADEYIPESEYYKYYQPKTNVSISVEEEHELDFPEQLKVFTFDRGDSSDFPDPCRNIIKIYDYLKVDGSDLLAALALGVQPNDAVLDMCSSSGNIAYCILQTLRPKFLVCANDRKGTIRDFFNEYLLDFSQLESILYTTQKSIDDLESDYLFDKVLVNVPSTEDRTSLFENEGNIFHVLKTKSRLRLPEYQCELLTRGLKLVQPGGAVLYTSSTLSPVQNDGVVQLALRTMHEESPCEFVVKDLTPALKHTSEFFNYGNYLNLKFGTLVVPFLPLNFGPRYMCKIVKKEGTSSEVET